MMKKTFLYFAYGSNLLTERIRINNPSAVKIAVAKLQGYDLDFKLFGGDWHGAVATVVRIPDRHVWGVVYEVENCDLANLDRQECGYDPINVDVEATDGNKYVCRTYQLATSPDASQRPSRVYKNVIVKGAIEHGLPMDYVEGLRKIEDNGYDGPVPINLSFRG